MNLDTQVLQSQFTIDIGRIFHNYVSFDTKGTLSNKACHEIMMWKMNTTQRQTALMYTIAFANFNKFKPSVNDIMELFKHHFGTPIDHPDTDHTHDPDQPIHQTKMIIAAWWQKVSDKPDAPVPYDWFDMNLNLDTQFTHIAMCLLSMS